MADGNGQEMMVAEVKQLEGATSIQTRHNPPFDDGIMSIVLRFGQAGGSMPAWGDPMRDVKMREIFYAEGNDLVQGAANTVKMKMNALEFEITGPERQRNRLQLMLKNDAEMGKGWLQWLPKMVLDYLTQDKGAFSEKIRDGSGRVVSLAHMDAGQCTATNDPDFPVLYRDGKGVYHKMADADVLHIVDMPSTQENSTGNIGMCALSRVLKSARIIQMLQTYKDEKLSSRPVPGLLLAKGMTGKQVAEALKEADEREVSEKGRLLFRNIPILSAMSADYEAGLEMVEFRSIPDAMNLTDEVNTFVHLLALSFGLDVRDLGWSATQSGDTKADAQVQAQKARGKGMGELMQQIEFQLNRGVMPVSCKFAFDFQDDEEDRQRAEIEGLEIDNVRKMWEPSPISMAGLISDAEARNLLVDKGLLPEEFRIEDLTPVGTTVWNRPEATPADEVPPAETPAVAQGVVA